jgi:B12-binding domain/radical SAM domain protein
MDEPRFTFISDRFNRTAIACLLAALEDIADDPHVCLRVARSADADRLDFRSSGGAEILCLSTMTVNAAAAVELHRKLKRRWGAAFVSVCGGAHASGAPERLLAAGIDYCCPGEGEDVIRAVYRSVAQGGSLVAVPGLVHMKQGLVRGERAACPVDIGSISALPVRVRFPTHIEIGRGCRWACAYCQTPRIHGTCERYRTPVQVEEVVRRYAAFGMRDFRFLLPNALGYMSETPGVPNCDALEELLARSRKVCNGGRLFLGSFPSEVRPDYVTEPALRVLRAGVSNAGLVIGGQSGSRKMLDSVRRGHSVEDIRAACRTGLECGFEVSVDLVVGFPAESGEDRAATLDLVEDLGAAGVTTNMHFFVPLPGTPLVSARPVFLSPEERRRLDTFGQRGILRGRWRRQEQTAKLWTGR